MRIILPDALHARPADLLVRAAAQLRCCVFVVKGERRADARDILQVLALGAAKGDEILLVAEGEGGAAALEALATLIARDFDPDLVPETGASAAAGIAIGEAVVLEDDEDADVRPSALDDRVRAQVAFAQAREEVEATVAALPPHEAALFEPELTILDALEAGVLSRVGAGEPVDEAVRAEAVHGASDLVDDARHRLLDALSGRTGARARKLRARAGRDVIAVVHGITPSLVAALPANVVGILAAVEDEQLSGRGLGTSHAAILARGRGLPLAFVPEHVAFAVEDGATVVLDTTTMPARVWTDPSPARVEEARARRDALAGAARDDDPRVRAPLPIGVAVRVNVGSPREAIPAAAEGVGLLRTELLFADRVRAPREEEQAALYAAIAERTSGPVHARLFDAGGDKILPFLPPPPNDPGARGIALLRAHADLLAAQVRAIARAAQVAAVRVLIPLARDPDDVAAVRALAPPGLAIGAMIETVEAVRRVESIAAAADFVCIGTNDLASDALGVPREAGPDPLDLRVLSLIARTIEGAHARGRAVTVCGELAADPLGARILCGLGADALSVAAPRFAALKLELSGLTREEAVAAAEAALPARS